MSKETAKWIVKAQIDKYFTQEHYDLGIIDEILHLEGNTLLDEGINLIWTLLCGGAGTNFANANACIGVGDSSAAAAATQTGLQGTNKIYKGMDSGYPTYGTSQKATFKSTYGSTEGNFTWNEWSISNGNSDAATNLNRKVEAMGTKASGSTWVLTVDVSLA